MENVVIIAPSKILFDRFKKLINRSLNSVNFYDIHNQIVENSFNRDEIINYYKTVLNKMHISKVVYIPSILKEEREPFVDFLLACDLNKETLIYEIKIHKLIHIGSKYLKISENLSKTSIFCKEYQNSRLMKIDYVLCESNSNSNAGLQTSSEYFDESIEVEQIKLSLIDDIVDAVLNSEDNALTPSFDTYSTSDFEAYVKTLRDDVDFSQQKLHGDKEVSKLEIYFRQQSCCLNPIYELGASKLWKNTRVAKIRRRMGKHLARSLPLDTVNSIDIIIPVPETGKYYAQGISEQLGVPYTEAIVRNNSLGRGLQLENPEKRNIFIRKKLQVINELIQNKNVGIVDEAIFTGSTLKIIVEKLREANVKKIFLLIPTPFNIRPCEYNIQPRRNVLLDYVRREQINEYFDVDAVHMSSVKSLTENLSAAKQLCYYCFGQSDEYVESKT